MLKKSLQVCAEIENCIHQIYRNFESQSSSEELVTLWCELAIDEESHEQAIRFALKLPTENIVNSEKSKDDQEIAELHNQILAALIHVKKTALTETQMLKMAKKLEDQFLKVHAATAAGAKDEKLKKVFLALSKGDEKHIAHLNEIAARFL